ncbi:MAG: alpha/beta hydrolase [Flavobacteriales bacterium]|nr:alpha/beta hydrolase [Flavobacteriales bacterium]
MTVTNAVVYGANIGVNGSNQTLRLDVYAPTGDAQTDRPAAIVAFGGSFISGTRADVADICQDFAKRGYVAIAPDYRVGFFFPNEATTIRAVMRGAHDMKAVVRFLRKSVAESGNPYGIDPERIIVGGVSAGAISGIHAAYLDQDSEVPAVLVPEMPALGGIEGTAAVPDTAVRSSPFTVSVALSVIPCGWFPVMHRSPAYTKSATALFLTTRRKFRSLGCQRA